MRNWKLNKVVHNQSSCIIKMTCGHKEQITISNQKGSLKRNSKSVDKQKKKKTTQESAIMPIPTWASSYGVLPVPILLVFRRILRLSSGALIKWSQRCPPFPTINQSHATAFTNDTGSLNRWRLDDQLFCPVQKPCVILESCRSASRNGGYSRHSLAVLTRAPDSPVDV